jgi:hypothetical protein
MLQNIKLTVALISAAIFLCLPTNTQAAKFDDLTIVVSSCDKYSPLWEPFFVSLFKQWPSLQQENVSVPIALIANNSSYTSTRITMINNPNESSWSDNMLNALSQVKTKYVLIALDDYWLTAEVNEPRLLELYDGMRTEQAAMIQISYNNHNYQKGRLHPTLKNVMYTNKHAHYKASLQMAIWDKQALMFLLKPGEDPWAFELSGTARSHGYPQPFMSLSADEPIKYLKPRSDCVCQAKFYSICSR